MSAPSGLQKFITILHQQDYGILFFMTRQQFVHSVVVVHYRNYTVLAILFADGVFAVADCPSEHVRYSLDVCQADAQHTTQLLFPPFLEKFQSIIDTYKTGSFTAVTSHVQFLFFQHGKMIVSGIPTVMWTMIDFPTHYLGFVLSLSFEDFCRSKSTVHTHFHSLHSQLLLEVETFVETTWPVYDEQYSFLSSLKCGPYLESENHEEYRKTLQRFQQTGELLSHISSTLYKIRQELYNFEHDSIDWTFEESMDFAKRKRTLYKHSDRLRLFHKYALELLWILHVHITFRMVVYYVLHLKIEKTLKHVQDLIEFSPC
jgi:hypothetical protein